LILVLMWLPHAMGQSKDIRTIESLLSQNKNKEAYTYAMDAIEKHPKPSSATELYSIAIQCCLRCCKYNYDAEALPIYQKAIELSIKANDHKSLLESYILTQRFFLSQTHYDAAAKLYQESIYLVSQMESTPITDSLLGRYYFTVGNIYQRTNSGREAINCYNLAIPLLHKSGDIQGEVSAFMDIVESIMDGHYDIKQCRQYFDKCRDIIDECERGGGYTDYNKCKYFGTYAAYLVKTKQLKEALAYNDTAVWMFDRHLDHLQGRSTNFNRLKFVDIEAYYLRKRLPIQAALGNWSYMDSISGHYASYQPSGNLDDWGRVYQIIADYHFERGNITEAQSFYEAAAGLFHKFAQKYSAEYFDCMLGSISCDIALKQYNAGKISLLESVVDSIYPKRNLKYVDLVEKSSLIRFMRFGSDNIIAHAMQKSSSTIRQYVERNFASLNQSSFQTLWNTIDVSCSRALTISKMLKNPEDVSELVYQYAIMQKNINYISQNSVRNYDFDSERKLSEILDMKFGDVRNNLEDGDLAVEFTQIFKYDPEFRYSNPESCNYGYFAIAFNSQSPKPKVIPIFSRSEIEGFVLSNGSTLKHALEQRTPQDIEAIYSDTLLTSFVWSKILQQFPHERNIYISATGILHSLAIENLATGRGFMSGDYKISRVTSTTNIRNGVTKVDFRNCLLIGDINYSLPVQDQERIAESIIPNPGHEMRSRCNISHLSEHFLEDGNAVSRNKAPYKPLDFTGEECDYIMHRLEPDTCDYLRGDTALEESFKKLASSHQYDIIHIATHGYFGHNCPDDEPLNSSALIFAGANNYALESTSIPAHIDDGFLTAYEISEINLSHTQLAVLSACETGLGFVNSDGLFGLQRGFKLAGVNSILMSLWNVPDESTSLFMRKFYNSINQGATPQQALHSTKEYFRQGNRFPHPFYWAGFVVVE